MEETYRSAQFNQENIQDKMWKTTSLFELPSRRTSQLTDYHIQFQKYRHKDRFSTGVIEFNNPPPGKYEVTKNIKTEKGKSMAVGREKF